MKLDITKIYIDRRFRTKSSKSETDFSIELPRSFNVPDGVVAHIDDIVIPVSWSTIDERNRNCYVRMYYGSSVIADNYAFSVQNYTGTQFATELALNLNYTAIAFSPLLVFDCLRPRGEHAWYYPVGYQKRSVVGFNTIQTGNLN